MTPINTNQPIAPLISTLPKLTNNVEVEKKSVANMIVGSETTITDNKDKGNLIDINVWST